MNKKVILELVHWSFIALGGAIAAYSAVSGQISALPYAAVVVSIAQVLHKFLGAVDSGVPVVAAAVSVEPDVAAVVATVEKK